MIAFNEVRDQIQWAETRIELARAEIIPYIQDNAFAIEEEVDAETGEHVRKIKLIMPVPVSIRGYLRNAIVDLKHSFDMSLNAAAATLNASGFDSNYPWSDSPTGLRAIFAKRQSKPKTRLPQTLVDEILRQEPYGTGKAFSGGNDLIREIAKMANNKHTIGIVAAAKIQSISFKNLTIEGGASIVKPWDPVKQEMELIRYSGKISNDNPTVAGNVFFERVGRLDALPAIDTSVAFCDRAKACLEGFEAACRHH